MCFDVPVLGNTATSHTYSVYLQVSSGTFTLDAYEQNFYIRGTGFAGASALAPYVDAGVTLDPVEVAGFTSTAGVATLISDIVAPDTETIEPVVVSGISTGTPTITLA